MARFYRIDLNLSGGRGSLAGNSRGGKESLSPVMGAHVGNKDGPNYTQV
jgi:hypothetical protein